MGGEVKRNRPGRAAVVNRVRTARAVEIIIAGRTPQPVIQAGTDQTFDAAQRVARSIPTKPCSPVQADLYCLQRCRIGCSVSRPATADQLVCAAAALQRIIACTTIQTVGLRIAGNHIIAAGADDRFDRIVGVTCSGA